MSGLEYPKIDTLYERKKNGKVNVDNLKRPEFGIINRWQITEKLNGRNIRVMLTTDGNVTFAGRMDEKHLNDQLVQKMIDYLKNIFTSNRMKYVFRKIDADGTLQKPEVCMYLEGLGSDMASGSGIYCKGRDVSVRLIDCYINPWWIERPLLEEFAKKFGIKCTPLLDDIYELPRSLADLENIIKLSKVAGENNNNLANAEGIVARTYPLLTNRKGDRVMWKLKFKDFEKR